MALIADESVLEVKRAVDIAEVVRSYVPGLKKAGANYKALCPFHDEKTPSFNVHPEKQIYKCFGCGKAGDAISFVMEMEKVDYPDAIRALAERTGITLQYRETGTRSGPRKEDLYRVNEWAAGVYRELLSGDEAAPARAYLKKRGVSREAEEQFRLGYSLDEWEGLLSRGRKAGFDDSLMLAAGLAIERDGGRGCYDRFRGRLMFPITDARGKVVGFGARALGDEEPKYINTSETALFSKGRHFYGLDAQREELEKTRCVHIVEGYFDVILPYQHGVRGLVATLGTALTRDHLKVLRRYVEKVVLVFDGDEAGRRANERGLDLLLGENMDLFVAGLPADEDPCDVVVNHGADRLREALSARQEIFDFLVDSVRAKHGEETTAARARAIDDILERIGRIPDAVKVDLLIRRLAERFRLEERSLRQGLRRKIAVGPGEAAQEDEPTPAPEEVVGRVLLGLLVTRPESAGDIRRDVPLERFPGAVTRQIAEKAYANPSLSGGDLLALLDESSQRQVLAGLLEEEVDDREAARRFRWCVDFLRMREFRGATAPELKAGARQARSDEELRRCMEELLKRRCDQPQSLPRL
ncbi:MAG: DNA primase [Planctomycetes bacterium]|nr:DNA primase [Planctomycetota bacterium]